MTENFVESDIELSDSDNGSDDDVGITNKKGKRSQQEIDEVGSDNEDVSDGASEEDGSDDEDEHESVYGGEPVDPETSKLLFNGDYDDDDDDDDDDNDENYLQKFSDNLKKDIISDYHPELKSHNYEEVETLCKIVKNESGVIIDPLHKTLPFITKYEKTRILGERAKQLNAGAKPFIEVDNSIIDGYLIALKEYEQKKIPFIIRRPIPDGTCEYWKLKDLEMLD